MENDVFSWETFCQSACYLNEVASSANAFIETLCTFFNIELERIPENANPCERFVLLEHFIQVSDYSLQFLFLQNPSPCLEIAD